MQFKYQALQKIRDHIFIYRLNFFFNDNKMGIINSQDSTQPLPLKGI